MEYVAGTTIIRQADEGDNFYVVETGCCKCYIGSRDETGLVATCNPGDCFGELALMYNAPRAAAVMADTDTALWALDRASFSILLMQAALNRRQQNQDFLEYVPVLATLNKYDKGVLADALEECTFENGTVIFAQGDPAEEFFILQEGEVAVSQLAEGAETPTELAMLRSGDYFGCETNPLALKLASILQHLKCRLLNLVLCAVRVCRELGLLLNKPRFATCTAIGETNCVKVSRGVFEKVAPSFDSVMRKNARLQYKGCPEDL